MNTTNAIPAGFREDARGRLIPESQIRDIDLARDELVREIVGKAQALSAMIRIFKEGAFDDIAAFVQLSAEKYDAKIGGDKGNVTLFTLDGRYKVVRAYQERLVFDERLQAAKALIDGCIKDWSEGSRPELLVLVNDAFRVDRQGNVSTHRVLALPRLNIKDEKWLKAMDAIAEAITVGDSKAYVRIYERNAKGEYLPVSLDVASA